LNTDTWLLRNSFPKKLTKKAEFTYTRKATLLSHTLENAVSDGFLNPQPVNLPESGQSGFPGYEFFILL
jgi:hypothetical protein